jgi:predicted ATPase
MNIEKMIKTEHRVLTEMIPGLKEIVNPSSSNDDSSTNIENFRIDAVNRFKYVFRMFIGAISSKENPIVFLLDDLHWADESSLDLCYALLSDTATSQGILYIVTHRIDEPSDRLRNFLQNIHHDSIRVSKISLQNFSSLEINDMLSEIMMLDPDTVAPLTNRIYRQTKGNIFFVLEYLRCLYAQKLLTLDKSANKWKWDIDDERFVTHDSLQDLLTSMIHSTTESTRNFLIYAASLGTKLDESILGHLTLGSVSLHLQKLAATGWIKFDGFDSSWKFSHDAIKEAAYQMIPDDERNIFHYRIGRKLWLKLSLDEMDRNIFVIVSQLLFGTDFITKQEERTAIAKLCLRAGERSVEFSHFHSAYEYLSKGILLLGLRGWRDEYELCLKLHDANAEVAFCIGDHNSVNQLVGETIRNSRVFDDTIQVLCTKLHSLGSNGQLRDAISYGFSILRNLAQPIPIRCKSVRLFVEMRKVKKKTKGMSDTDILRLPVMQDQSRLAAMKIINAIILYVILVDPEQMPFLGLRIVSLSLEYGLNGMSSVGFVLYGVCLAR